jgi:hypothetical protein
MQIESLILCQKTPNHIVVGCFFSIEWGFEEGGLAQQGKKVSGGHFFSPGENPLIAGRSPCGCGRRSIWLSFWEKNSNR